jgi:FtsH-binding integral membrane protein
MNNTTTHTTFAEPTSIVAQLTYRVFGWMSLGLVITGVVAAAVNMIPGLTRFIFLNDWVIPVLFLVELAVVLGISWMGNRMHYLMSGGLFLFYSFLNGIFFSIIFLVYTATSIAAAFALSAGVFAMMSIYGFVTKQDLTKWGQIAMMGLFAVIIASIVNAIFFLSDGFAAIMNYVVVGIFVVLIAYDTQKIKRVAETSGGDMTTLNKASIQLALQLYLDFINLFLRILRIMGKRK